MSWLDENTTEESVSTFDLKDFTSLDNYPATGGCDCGCGAAGGSIKGGCDGCTGGNETIEGGAHPLLVGPLTGLGLVVVGVLIILYFYYSDEADPLGWIPDMEPETKYWGARSGAITAMVGVAVGAAVPLGYMVKATKIWGLAIAAIIIGIIILVVCFTYDERMAAVFGPVNEDAMFWSKVAGGIIIGIGVLPFVGKAIFMGGKGVAKFKARSAAMSSAYDMSDLDYAPPDDEPESDIYQHEEPDKVRRVVNIGSDVYSKNKSQIDTMVSRGLSKLKKG